MVSCQSSDQPYEYERHYTFDRADTLRGMLGPERSSFDVTHYLLDVHISPGDKSLEGVVTMTATCTRSTDRIQLDLFDNMIIDHIAQDGRQLSYHRDGNAFFVDINLDSAETFMIDIAYHGEPVVARQAPWDGGFVWKEAGGSPWIGVACEGTGASLWWPNKDHLSDEPDSMDIILHVPNGLMAVSNGDLIHQVQNKDETAYHWKVDYPINNYNVSVNIADYVHFSESYTSDSMGTLDLDYYVLRENETIARKHFQQTAGVLEAFEYWFGPYPFWNDGFALVETPYLGMEHQSAIAYGNKYMRGYLGRLEPAELDFDYIIVHEAGHEWWGNSISTNDHAEMWIHESYTTYMEALYVEYHHDKDVGTQYLLSQRPYISNRQPIIGPLDVNFGDWVSSDQYYKGSWMLHTLRHVIPTDRDWREYLRGLYAEFQMGHATTDEIVAFTNEYFAQDLSAFFDQYLRHQSIPVFEYYWSDVEGKSLLHYRWNAYIEGFAMPFELRVDGSLHRLDVTQSWQEISSESLGSKNIAFALDRYLVDIKEVKP